MCENPGPRQKVVSSKMRSQRRGSTAVKQIIPQSSTFGDGVQEGLLDVLEAELVEQKLDGLHGLGVDGEVERVAAHVVHAVDVEVDLGLLEGLADDGHVAEGGRVEVEALLIRELQGKDRAVLLGDGRYSFFFFFFNGFWVNHPTSPGLTRHQLYSPSAFCCL